MGVIVIRGGWFVIMYEANVLNLKIIWWDPISIRSEKRRQSGWESNRGEELRVAELGAWGDGTEGMELNDCHEVPVVGRHG